MTQEEFANSIKEINLQKGLLNQKEKKLREEYINEHKTASVGDRVIATIEQRGVAERKEQVFVRSVNCHDSGKIWYSFWKIKRNGEKSQIRFREGWGEEIKSIELIEPAKTKASDNQ